LWHRLGAQGSGRSVFAYLAQAYSESARTYHNTNHILDCLSQLDLSRELANRLDEVEAAVWFHDVVYVPAASDNENRSAQLAEIALAACGAPLEVGRRVAELILTTRHLTIPQGPDAQLLSDIDLSILGRDPAVFDRFESAIRREYGQVDDAEYRAGRAKVLAGFLRREEIYQTGFFRTRYEQQARANLERALAQLSS
jgi:predicted metal-dependent HD superfamily phosphohydrolase